MPRLSLRWLVLVLAIVALATAGCDRDEIQTYTVPKPPPPAENVRMLAAVFDVGENDQWYFKIVGPVAEIDKLAKPFAEFVSSAQFTNKADKPVEWTVPKEWKEGKARPPRYAAFFPDPKNEALELTVFKFEKQSDLVSNVNRWCDVDLGLPHFRNADLDRLRKQGKITTVKAGKNVGELVDLRGPGAKKKMPAGHPPMGGDVGKFKDMGRPDPEREPKPAGKSPIKYDTPAGWTDTGPRQPQSQFDTPKAATFALKEGVASARVLVSIMPGRTVADVGNVGRWRGEVGMKPLSAEEVNNLPARAVAVDGMACKLYEFNGDKMSTVMVLVHRAGVTWFVKMIGDNDAVNKNRDKFAVFAQSIKFIGGAER